MTYRVVEFKRTRDVPDARACVTAQGEALAKYLGEALRDGYDPATGEPRERKADGKPRGYDEGVLARGLTVKQIGAAQGRARVRIDPSPSRLMLLEVSESDGESFISRHGIITTDGVAADVIRQATSEYMRSLNL